MTKYYKLPKLKKGITFKKGPGFKKYTAIFPDGKRVTFGDVRYEHYKDRVPKSLGGKVWSHKNHNDSKRRENYRKRHRGVLLKSGKAAYQKK